MGDDLGRVAAPRTEHLATLVLAATEREARDAAHELGLEQWRYLYRPEQLLGVNADRPIVFAGRFTEHPAFTSLSKRLELMRALAGTANWRYV